MGRGLLPRVTYWTGTWDPQREAISKEIEILRRARTAPAPVVAFSLGNRSALLPHDGVWRLSGRRWWSFRALAALIERCGEVTHAFGHLDGWHLLRALGRRPVAFTVAVPGPLLDRWLYDRVRVFVAESESLAAFLRASGIPRERVRIVYPGVDLVRFQPAPPPDPSRFRILFGSTPADPAEFDARGIPLLVELARRHPDIDVVVLWRQWGDLDGAQQRLNELRPPPNFKVERRTGRDMAAVYASVHATACFFREGFGKSCPNSIVEGLACGRPALVTDTCGIADLIADRGAGVSVPRSVEALSGGLERLRLDLARRRCAARRLAENCFGLEQFIESYRSLYEELAARP